MILFKILHKIFGDYNALKRNYNQTKNNKVRKFYRLIMSYYNHESCSGIPLYIKNNGSINFVHGYSGIFISGSAELKNNVTIYQNVTIGSIRQIDSKGFGAPIIGENVILGAGCMIIGKVVIGNNCRIAPNAFVNIDLPDNTIYINDNVVINKNRLLINRVYQNLGNEWIYLENGNKITEKNGHNITLLNTKTNN